MRWLAEMKLKMHCGSEARSATSPRLQRDRGQALLEMALALPIVLGLLLGIIEVGRYAEIAIVVQDAAKAGALYGAQNLATAGQINNAAPPNGIEIAAQTDANLGPGGTGLQVSSCSGVLPGPTCTNIITGASVPACTTFSDSTTPVPYIIVRTRYATQSLFSSSTHTLNGCAQMQVAQ